MVSAKEIKSNHRLEEVVASYGIVLKKKGANSVTACCPFHKEKTPSFDVDVQKQLFLCRGCHKGGDVINFVSAIEGISMGDAFNKLTPEHLRPRPYRPPSAPPKIASPQTGESKPAIDINNPDKTYSYKDEFGVEVFQVLRYVPKDFRQRHKNDKGEWVWNMDGVRRVLYNLPNVLKSPAVILVGGEKDAETINELGLVGTTNSGGEDKWMDGYSETLKGKDVILFGDNDDTGRRHVKRVAASLQGKVKTLRILFTPEGKDVTEYRDKLMERGATKEEFSTALEKLVVSAIPLEKGFDIPIYSMRQLEVMYRNEVCSESDNFFDLGKLFPTLGRKLRPARAGDLVTIMAGTGVGKSNLAQMLMMSAAPMKCLFFQLELSEYLTFERFVGMDTGVDGRAIERAYKEGRGINWSDERLSHVFTCPNSRVTTDQIESLIKQSEMVIGEKPKIVVVDYAQLVGNRASDSYSRVSEVAEQLRIIAKATKTIIILLSQVGRSEEEVYKELGMHDAKNSGSIENSSSLLIGIWRDRADPQKLYLKIIKDTKTESAGLIVPIKRNAGMKLVEVSIIDEADIPR